ncbi:MAG: hypothetical protein JJ975_10660 [Bacteroidia bacterium]|nr:hypothetical protein [Bacteroidia bacterium]
MSGGGGFMYEMNSRIRQNRELLKMRSNRRNLTQVYRQQLRRRKLEYKHSSPEELASIRKEIEVIQRRKTIASVVSLLIGVCILIASIIGVRFWLKLTEV